MADFQVSNEEKVQIATGFLLASPPGEFNEVAADVRTLVGNDGLLNPVFGSIAQAYNTDQMAAVDVPGQSHKVCTT